MSDAPRVIVVDDHPLYRVALVQALSDIFGPESVIYEAGDAAEAMARLKSNPEINLVLLDLTLPGQDGLSAMSTIRRKFPDLSVVIISGTTDLDQITASINAGALGFVPKTCGTQELTAAMRLVSNGEMYVPPQFLPELDPELKVPQPHAPKLTPRQQEVLAMIAQGLPNKRIASELNIQTGTVKLHVHAILRTLNCNNRTEAVMKAAESGLI